MSDQSSLSDFESESDAQSDLFECEICGRSFDSNKGRGIHRGNAHNDAEVKELMLTEIQRLADELGESPSLHDMDQLGKFGSKTYQKKFSSWNDALKKADVEINKQQKVSDPELLKELRRLSKEISGTPASRDMAELGEYAPSSYSIAFGTWNNAIQAAGVKIGRHRDVSEAELISEIQSLASDLGHPPTVYQMRDQGRFGVSTVSNEFGTWNDALKAAGFEPNREKDVDKAKLKDEIRRLNQEYGRPPTANEMESDGKYSVGAFGRSFGSWNEALSATGFEPHNRNDIPDEELLAELNRLGDELDRTPTVIDMEAKGEFGHSTYENSFGSWNDAIRRANLDVNVRSDIPNSELIDELHSVKKQLGKTPGMREMDQHGRFDSTTYEAKFGTWNDALKAAGLNPILRSDIPEPELIDEIERLADELNRPPTRDEMEQRGAFSGSIYARRFGTWTDGLLEAGLDPHKTLHPDYLDHEVRSQKELQIADMLIDAGIDYEYESLVIEYADGHTYTPDFVTDKYVIEVKGVHFGEIYNKSTTAQQKAEAAIEKLDDREYVVVGVELPADIYIPWDERATIGKLFE
jgi:hypothetical protein